MRAVIEFEHDNDIPKYKKKSRKSGLKRSTHKHQNIHVQLEYFDRHRLEMYGDRHVPTSEGSQDAWLRFAKCAAASITNTSILDFPMMISFLKGCPIRII